MLAGIPHVRPTELPPNHGLGCVIDVETTGLDPSRHEVIELGLVLFAFDRSTGEVLGIVDEYLGQREPVGSIPKAATAVHGLTKRALKGKQLDYGRIEEILMKAEFFLAHNARFDHAFVSGLIEAANEKPWYCSMNGIDWRGRGYSSKGLQNLLRDHSIPSGTAHRGLDDSRAVLQLVSQPNQHGVPYLLELLTGRPAVRPGAKKGGRPQQPSPPERPRAAGAAVGYRPAKPKETGCLGCSGCLTVILTVVVMVAILALVL